MELDAPISPELAAIMLYAIESDLAGAAGTPGELDNIALSGLTLKADTGKLYRMRYVNLPQSYYVAYGIGLANATYYEQALTSHVGQIDSLEKPAVLAALFLCFEPVHWARGTGLHGGGRGLSL